MYGPLILLAGLTGILLLWYESLRAREQAVRHARAICRGQGLQLLDQTVALTSLWPARNRRGRLQLQRIYAFEVSETGAERNQARMVVLGRRVEVVYLEGADGTTIIYGEAPAQLH